MARIFAAAAAGLLMTIAGSAHADVSVSQTGFTRGGHIRDFAAVVRKYNASGERVRIDGLCRSACTMLLAIRNVCVEPSAQLAFHAGHSMEPGHRSELMQRATNSMLAAYKPRLRNYLRANRYMETLEYHTISGQDLISKFGYPACR